MQFFIENKVLDGTVRAIRRQIRVSMNGVVADAMLQHGVVYKKNFGVDIPRLRQMAAKYAPDHDLAQRLWALKVRETMILATLLQPVDKFTSTHADRWVAEIEQLEMAEQATMNLFAKLPYAADSALRWIHADMRWHRISGWLLIARVWQQLSNEQTEQAVNRALLLADTDDALQFQSIAMALCRLSRRSQETADKIRESVARFEQAESFALRFIHHEVSQEISFADF